MRLCVIKAATRAAENFFHPILLALPALKYGHLNVLAHRLAPTVVLLTFGVTFNTIPRGIVQKRALIPASLPVALRKFNNNDNSALGATSNALWQSVAAAVPAAP